MAFIGRPGFQRAFQVAEAEQIDHAYPYYRNPNVHMFASRVVTKLATGFHASIVISLDHPFELSGPSVTTSYHAAAIGASTQWRTKLPGSPLISVCLEPPHEYFCAFRALPRPGVLPLDRASFSPLDDELRATACGDLPLEAAIPLIEKILAIVAPRLPKCGPLDARVLKMCELLEREPSIPLEEIAAAVGLSYDRASHLFAQAVGLPFRSHRLWCKMKLFSRLLWCGEPLTAAAQGAGFADSAHVCRTYRKLFGRPPSYFFDGRFVKIHVQKAPLATRKRLLPSQAYASSPDP